MLTSPRLHLTSPHLTSPPPHPRLILTSQARVRPTSAVACSTSLHSGACLPEIVFDPTTAATAVASADASVTSTAVLDAASDVAPFGYNWTHPTSPLSHQWRYFTVAELGANPAGQISAAIPSFRTFEGGGFVAVIIPFVSSTYLPEQRGTSATVADFRLHAVGRQQSASLDPSAVGTHSCVRLSWNGEHIHQLCDPNDAATGRTSGVVRAAVEEFFNDLKRAHFIDRKTRAVTITLPLRSNHLAVRSRVTLMVEMTATGTVLPSYDIETRVESGVKTAATRFYVDIAIIMVGVFLLLELMEICKEGM